MLEAKPKGPVQAFDVGSAGEGVHSVQTAKCKRGDDGHMINSIAKELNNETVLWNANFEDWRAENQSSVRVEIAMKQIAAQRLAICLGHDNMSLALGARRLLLHKMTTGVRTLTRRTW